MPEQEGGQPQRSQKIWPFTSEKDTIRAAEQYVSLKTPLPQKKKLRDRLLVTEEFAAQSAPVIIHAIHREDISTRHTFLDFFIDLVKKGRDLSGIAEEIAKMMADSNFALREKAAKLLMQMGPAASGATVRIFSLLRSKLSDIQLNAVLLLGRIGPICAEQAIPKIEQMLKGGVDKEVRDAASETLQVLRGEKEPEHEEAVEDNNSNDYSALSGKKILVVDDEAKLRRMISTSLKKFGVQVLEAVNGQEAFDLLSANDDVDLLVLDLMLPVMSGAEVLRLVRQEAKLANLPVYIISARTERSILMAMAKLDIAGYFMKPFKLSDILERINATLSEDD